VVNVLCCRTFVLMRRTEGGHMWDHHIQKWAQSDVWEAQKCEGGVDAICGNCSMLSDAHSVVSN
jgi:hypothetical protein